MSETLRERVAYTLYNREGRPPKSLRWEAISDQIRQPWLLDADATLSVIREHLQSDAAVERVAKAAFEYAGGNKWETATETWRKTFLGQQRAALAAALGDDQKHEGPPGEGRP